MNYYKEKPKKRDAYKEKYGLALAVSALLLMGVVLLSSSCGDLGSDDATIADVLLDPTDSSPLQTLFFETKVIIDADGGELGPVDGYHFEVGHLKEMKLTIDGQDWGIYFNESEQGIPAAQSDNQDIAGFRLTEQDRTDIFVLRFSESTPIAELKTAGQWVDELSKNIAVGRHLLFVESLTLTNEDGDQTKAYPRQLIELNADASAETMFFNLDVVVTELIIEESAGE